MSRTGYPVDRMRRLGALLLVSAALVVAGCGSSSSAGSGDPVNSALSYFPSGSAFVMSVATDPKSAAIKQLQSLVGRFPIATFGESAALAKLNQVGIDYQADVKPLFGNPVMFGFAGPMPTGSASRQFLFAWVTKDSGKLGALVKKLPGVKSVGSHDGAKLYQTGGSATVAIHGATLVFGSSESVVNGALDRHAHGGGMRSADYTHAVAGLPQNGFLQIFGSLSAVLSQPSTAKARLVPWVAALRGYAATVGASPTGLSFDFKLDTSGRALAANQVPFASGTGTPNFADSMPITVALENPAHLVSFIEGVEQTTGAAGWAKFERNQAKLRAATGADLNSLLKLLTGELILSSDTHTTMARAAVNDPASAASILSKLVRAPHGLLNSTSSVARRGSGFYAIKSPSETITLGVVGNQMVVGKASVAQLRSFASAPTSPAVGARGSVAFRVSLSQLLHLAMSSSVPKVAEQILSSLGDVNGEVSAAPSGITGSASLAIH